MESAASAEVQVIVDRGAFGFFDRRKPGLLVLAKREPLLHLFLLPLFSLLLFLPFLKGLGSATSHGALLVRDFFWARFCKEAGRGCYAGGYVRSRRKKGDRLPARTAAFAAAAATSAATVSERVAAAGGLGTCFVHVHGTAIEFGAVQL